MIRLGDLTLGLQIVGTLAQVSLGARRLAGRIAWDAGHARLAGVDLADAGVDVAGVEELLAEIEAATIEWWPRPGDGIDVLVRSSEHVVVGHAAGSLVTPRLCAWAAAHGALGLLRDLVSFRRRSVVQWPVRRRVPTVLAALDRPCPVSITGDDDYRAGAEILACLYGCITCGPHRVLLGDSGWALVEASEIVELGRDPAHPIALLPLPLDVIVTKPGLRVVRYDRLVLWYWARARGYCRLFRRRLSAGIIDREDLERLRVASRDDDAPRGLYQSITCGATW